MRFLLVAIVFVMAMGTVCADDIVSMPSANMLKAGEIDLAAYHFSLDNPAGAPQSVELQTLYVGLTDKIELDAFRTDVDTNKTSVVLVANVKLLSETATMPDLVFGCKNITGEETLTGFTKSEDRSYYLSAAKTFFIKPGVAGPPLVRGHLSVGTADWTMLGEERHKGLFGGLQFLIRPDIGAVIENDGTDTITALTYMPANTGLTIKGGTFGDHTWFGLAWRKDLQ